ncbi:hypothetical protein Ocin01_01134 [Orchesella cincta]|uniref:Transmembrane protein n=1 Tax=Orchesella cincta TaxID=48709 RepID=A0A1D2NJV4_ORCCI|nr:hypothetical protein Ocin01_01134 [Orchesella cincta]
MDNLLLRLNWSSFLVGSQISSAVGILTLSVYTGIKLRNSREYLYPSVHNGGETIFLFRIKEPGNWWRIAPQMHFRIFEKYMIGGLLYAMLENHYELEDSLPGAFICGGALGAYCCCSFQNNMPSSALKQILSYSTASGIFATICQTIKGNLVRGGIVKASNFKATISVDLISFSVGATIGYIVGLYYGHFTDNFEPILFPEIDDTDSSWDVTRKASRFLADVCCCLMKLYLHVEERILVSGALYCSIELLLGKIFGIKSHFATTPICGAILGSYFGLLYSRNRTNARNIALVSGAIACVSRFTWSLGSAEEEDMRELLLASSLHHLDI